MRKNLSYNWTDYKTKITSVTEEIRHGKIAENVINIMVFNK